MSAFDANSPDTQLLLLANEVTDAVTRVLTGTSAKGMTGAREGQYAVDVAADAAALATLHHAGVPVLSEESGSDGFIWPLGGNDLIGILDPLDGSTNADRGVPWYSTSIAFLDRSGLRVGVVKNQVNGDVYSAVRGGGAFCNGTKLNVASSRPLNECVVGVSALPPRGVGWWQFRALGSAALDLCLVASGALDAWVDFGSHGVWDYAAGVLIVEEAGGAVGERDGLEPLHGQYSQRRSIRAASNNELLVALAGF